MRSEPAPDGAPVAVAAPDSPPRRVRLLVAIAVLVVLADLVSKLVVVARLQPDQPVEVISGAVYLVLIRNPGAAFSLATGMTWLLTVIAVAVVVAIVRMARTLRSAGWACGLGLVLGGALGNLIDRIFRAPGVLRGHVVDFLSVILPGGYHWPVFNLADSGIVTGGALLVLLAFLGHEPDGRRANRGKATADASDDDPAEPAGD